MIGNRGTIKPTDEGFEVEAELDGESARDLNRNLHSEMRKVEKRTRIHPEWTLGNTTERFFDYALKATKKYTSHNILKRPALLFLLPHHSFPRGNAVSYPNLYLQRLLWYQTS
jgi:hypothetical protein